LGRRYRIIAGRSRWLDAQTFPLVPQVDAPGHAAQLVDRRDAHEGYVSWKKAETIRKMVSSNVPTSRHHGAPKHGDALLAGVSLGSLSQDQLVER
jgi:hypothetical protein